MAAAQAWTDSRAAGLAAGLIAATYPQSVFIGAYTNADAFTLAAGALLVLAVARWARRGEGSVALVPVGAAAGLVVLGKMSGYYLLPVTFLWAGWAVWTHRASARAGLLSLAACAGLSAPFLAWNALRNRGDALGLQRYGRFVAEHGTPVDKLDLPDAGSTFVFGLLKSSFGVFGNLHILMPGVFYLVAVGLLGAGCIVLFTGWGRASGVSRRAGLWLALGIVINLALVFLNSWYVDFQAQGRYILLNALLLTCIGVQGVDSLLEGRAPWAWRRFLVAFFALSAVVALGRVYQRPCQPVPVARATPAAPHHPVDPVR